jgi:3-oxoacyl-[acyl-carrier-protein] synthase II
MRPEDRIVITGIGLTAPNGNTLAEFRKNLLEGKSGVTHFETRFMGEVMAGVCDFDELKYQKKKSLRRGTRAGSIAIYCAQEAVADSGMAFDTVDKSRVGVYLGTTEHGNVETENEVHAISKYGYDTKYWSHHHNPRTVANNPAGEITLNMGITGPHYAIGAACAAGNLGIIQGVQMLRLNEIDMAWPAASRKVFAPSVSSPVSRAKAHWRNTPTPPRRADRSTRTAMALCVRRADASILWNACTMPRHEGPKFMARL